MISVALDVRATANVKPAQLGPFLVAPGTVSHARSAHSVRLHLLRRKSISTKARTSHFKYSERQMSSLAGWNNVGDHRT